MREDLPAIVKCAEQLLLETEKAVRSFPRYHKYSHGSVLRAEAMKIAKASHRAWRARATRLVVMHELSEAIDDFKLSLQLAQQLRIFNSEGQFTVVARLASETGKQCGGWLKQQHLKRQHAASHDAIPQGPQKLSPRVASVYEAHP